MNKKLLKNVEEILYEGKVKFSYGDKEHLYTVAKKAGDTWTTPEPKTGITTVTNIIAKDALIFWAGKVVAESFKQILKDNPNTPLAVAEKEAKTAPTQARDAGSGMGSLVHTMIEALTKGREIKMPTDPGKREVAERIKKQYEAFIDEYKPETIHAEKPMYSLEHDFCGTDDWLGKIGGKVVLIDYKSSNRSRYSPDGIFAPNFAQLGGQIILVEEQLGIEVEDAWIVNFAKSLDGKDEPEFKYRALSEVGLTKTEAKLYFLHCLGLYRLNQKFEWSVK